MANEFVSPPTCVSVEKLSQAKVCAKSIFYQNHLDTEYGSAAYMAFGMQQRETIIKSLEFVAKNNPDQVAKDYKELVMAATYLVVVSDQNELSYFSIYAMGAPNALVVLDKVAQDWFEYDYSLNNDDSEILKQLFAIEPNFLLEQYSY